MSTTHPAVHSPGLASWYYDQYEQRSPEDRSPGRFDVVTEPDGQRRMWYVCPGCRVLGAVAIRPVVDGTSQSWEWNGSLEKPTLRPSLHHVGCWHGWLTDGVFHL